MEVLYAVGAAGRANFIQPMQSLAIVGVHGYSYRIAEAPFRDVHAQVFDFLKQPLVEKRLPCRRLERAKRTQHIPENKASTNCKAQLRTLTTLDAREKLCRVQKLFKHLSSTYPYSMKDIVVLLCAAKQNAIILVLRGCTDPDSPRPERGMKTKCTVAPNWRLHLWLRWEWVRRLCRDHRTVPT